MAIKPLQFYDAGRLYFFDGTIIWKTVSKVTAVLLDDTYTPAADHEIYSDLTGELTMADYAQKEVISRTTERRNNNVLYKSNGLTWGNSVTISAQYLVLVVGTPTALNSSDKLIGYVDFGELVECVSSQFSFSPDNNTWFTVEEPIWV